MGWTVVALRQSCHCGIMSAIEIREGGGHNALSEFHSAKPDVVPSAGKAPETSPSGRLVGAL